MLTLMLLVCGVSERFCGGRAQRRRVPGGRTHADGRGARLPAEQPAARQEPRARRGYTVSYT